MSNHCFTHFILKLELIYLYGKDALLSHQIRRVKVEAALRNEDEGHSRQGEQ